MYPISGTYGACSAMAQGSCARQLSGRRKRHDEYLTRQSILCISARQTTVPIFSGFRRATAHLHQPAQWTTAAGRSYSRRCAGAERLGAVRCARDACSVRQNGRNGRQGRGQHQVQRWRPKMVGQHFSARWALCFTKPCVIRTIHWYSRPNRQKQQTIP